MADPVGGWAGPALSFRWGTQEALESLSAMGGLTNHTLVKGKALKVQGWGWSLPHLSLPGQTVSHSERQISQLKTRRLIIMRGAILRTQGHIRCGNGLRCLSTEKALNKHFFQLSTQPLLDKVCLQNSVAVNLSLTLIPDVL